MGNSKGMLLFLIAVLLVFSFSSRVFSTPDSVTTTIVTNYTSELSTGTIANLTNDGLLSGGYIFVMNVTGDSQNVRWKAFVGNVSGRLTLDDASGETIYDWSISSFTGEIYATRYADTVNWSGINCAPLNATEIENTNLSHTNPDDNITATFNGIDNQVMTVGTVSISPSTCRTINVYQNSADTGAGADVFEELVLYDNGNRSWDQNQSSFGRIVYAQNLEQDEAGFNNSLTFDFQLIVPERGSAGWASSTAYYFYMELT